MITLILIGCFLIVVASVWWFGAWSNLITLVNVVLAGLVAVGFYENVTYQFYQLERSYILIWEFVALWLLFAGSFMLLRAITDALSGYRLRFDRVTELVGRTVLSLSIGFVFVSFVAFTLHAAPLPTTLFERSSERMGTPGRNSNLDETFGPDIIWASTCQILSKGSLAYTADETAWFGSYREYRNRGPDVAQYLDDSTDYREFNANDSWFRAGVTRRMAVYFSPTLRLPIP